MRVAADVLGGTNGKMQRMPIKNSPRDQILFWSLLAAQTAGSQVIIWIGIPIYRRLKLPIEQGATTMEFAKLAAAVALMLVSHWLSLPVRRRMQFRRNVLFGHVLVWIGELSIFFVATVVALILFERFGKFLLWKLFVLSGITFAVSSYKYLVMSVGEEMIEAEPQTAAAADAQA